MPSRPAQPPTNTTTKPFSQQQLTQPPITTPSAQPTLTPTTQPSQPPAVAVAAAGPEIGGMSVTDATTLPRARVLEVTRRLEGSTARLAMRVELLATGEEKEVDDRGLGGPISVAADIQPGDLVTLTPTGPATFQWQKSSDPSLASTLR